MREMKERNRYPTNAFADHKCSEKIRIIKCQAYWYATHHAETHMQTFIPLFLTFLQFSRHSKLFTPYTPWL